MYLHDITIGYTAFSDRSGFLSLQSLHCCHLLFTSYIRLMNIFVSNVNASAHKNHLKNLFSEFGFVRSAIMIKGYFSKKTNTSCWIVIDNHAEAENAIKHLDHTAFMQKTISVREARLYL